MFIIVNTCVSAADLGALVSHSGQRHHYPASQESGTACGRRLPPSPLTGTSCCTSLTTLLSLHSTLQNDNLTFTRCSFNSLFYFSRYVCRDVYAACHENVKIFYSKVESVELYAGSNRSSVRHVLHQSSVSHGEGPWCAVSAATHVRLRGESADEIETWHAGGGRLSLLSGCVVERGHVLQ